MGTPHFAKEFEEIYINYQMTTGLIPFWFWLVQVRGIEICL